MFLSKNVIDLKNGNYTFSDYFKMNIDHENLAKVFGYQFKIDNIDFKKNELNDNLMDWIKKFSEEHKEIKKSISLETEIAKREFLISPIIFELIKNIHIQVKIEANTYYDKTLKGVIDYILNNDKNVFIAIEAKDSDIPRGLKQLMAELIAIDKIVEEKSDFIYGAVTIGFDWNFVILDRKDKIITQNLCNLHIESQLKDIVQILVGILG